MHLGKTVKVPATGSTELIGQNVVQLLVKHELEVVTTSYDEMKARHPSILIITKAA
jgi:hypothetical protein